jgi:hypothetical protein
LFLHHYRAYTYQDLLKEKAIIFYVLLDEAMIIEAEDNYFTLYSSIFNKFKNNIVSEKLKKLSRIFAGDIADDNREHDIIKDREQLKNILKK